MNNSAKHQAGSAAILELALIATVIAFVGFVFYHSRQLKSEKPVKNQLPIVHIDQKPTQAITPPPAITPTTLTTPAVISLTQNGRTSTVTGTGYNYSFTLPLGWKQHAETYQVILTSANYRVLPSEVNRPFDQITDGAEIEIDVDNQKGPLEYYNLSYDNTQTYTTVDGKRALQFDIKGFENAYSTETIFLKDNLSYSIIYHYPQNGKNTLLAAYNSILSSFVTK